MRRRVLILSILFSSVVGVSTFGWSTWQSYESERLVQDARDLLFASVEDAPGLDRLHASTAMSKLRRAQDTGRNDGEIEGLIAFAQAMEDFQRNQLILAERGVLAARHRLGWSPTLRVAAASIARRRMLPEEAQTHLQAALEAAPELDQALLLAADLALDASDGASAIESLDQLNEQLENEDLLHNRRGLAFELLGDWLAAEDAYRDAVRMDERNVSAWINLGRSLRRLGNYRESLRAFGRATELASTNPDVYLGRGLVYAAMGDVTHAQTDLQRAAELAPNDPSAVLALGDLQRNLGNYSDAVDTYRRALNRQPGDPDGWLKLGTALTLLTDYEEAERAYRTALQRRPNFAAAYNGLGAALMHLGQSEEAIEMLRRASALDVGDPNPLMNLALLHERAGNLSAARMAWRTALERAPQTEVARTHLTRLGG